MVSAGMTLVLTTPFLKWISRVLEQEQAKLESSFEKKPECGSLKTMSMCLSWPLS